MGSEFQLRTSGDTSHSPILTTSLRISFLSVSVVEDLARRPSVPKQGASGMRQLCPVKSPCAQDLHVTPNQLSHPVISSIPWTLTISRPAWLLTTINCFLTNRSFLPSSYEEPDPVSWRQNRDGIGYRKYWNGNDSNRGERLTRSNAT